MFRISFIISVSLISCLAAKPWNKHPDEATQNAVRAIDEKEELSFKVEVEPPEDMDGISYYVDPHMRIWKSMTGSGHDTQPLKVEEDLDELHHPSVSELLNQNLGPAADIQLLQEVAKIQFRQEAEEERDDIDHPVWEKLAAEPDLFPLGAKNKAQLQPEEDMDDIYHKDSLIPVVNHDNTEAAAPLDLFQGKYSVPEEDLDHIYHQ